MRDDGNTIQKIQEKCGRGPMTAAEGEDMAKKIKAVGYMECSALTRDNLKSVFDEAIRTVLFPPEPPKPRGFCRFI